ncbi:MAG: cupredoxin domain-containing protein [Gemmatimonadota bacterium]
MASIVIVDLLVVAAMAWVVWYFWLSEKKAVRAAESGGSQEVRIVVRGGYDPDVIVVDAGRPVRLHFDRQETAACSEMVVFPDFDISRQLPAGETVTIELTPEAPGEYDFSCQMGMIRGKLIAG